MRSVAICLIFFFGFLAANVAIAQEMQPELVYSSEAAQKLLQKTPVVIYGT